MTSSYCNTKEKHISNYAFLADMIAVADFVGLHLNGTEKMEVNGARADLCICARVDFCFKHCMRPRPSTSP